MYHEGVFLEERSVRYGCSDWFIWQLFSCELVERTIRTICDANRTGVMLWTCLDSEP